MAAVGSVLAVRKFASVSAVAKCIKVTDPLLSFLKDDASEFNSIH